MSDITRRNALIGLAGTFATLSSDGHAIDEQTNRRQQMAIACFIRYQIDPYMRDDFQKYAEAWGRIIPRCGGHLIGYFLPHEGTNDIGWGLIAFDSLCSYEVYRERLRSNAEAHANFDNAQKKRFILREERNFVRIVDGTFELSSMRNGFRSPDFRVGAGTVKLST